MKKKFIALSLVLVMIGNIFLSNNIGAVFTPLIAVAENTTRDNAVPIATNVQIEDVLDSSDDVNWYTFSIPSAGSVSFELSREVFDDTNNYWRINLYYFDENLKQVTTAEYDGNHTVSSSPNIGLPAGEYFMEMKIANYRYNSNPYILTVKYSESDNWEKELNETYRSATSIFINENYSGSLSTSEDIDWYVFDVQKEGNSCIDFERDVFDSNEYYWSVTLCLLDEEANAIEELARWEFNGNRQKSSSPEVGLSKGKYYLKIQTANYRHLNSTYNIKVNYDDSDYFEKEPNNEYRKASDIQFNTNYNGSLYTSSDNDWYRFSISEYGYISIDFSREVFDDANGYWLLKLHKFDENMQEMASWTFDGNHQTESTAEIGLSKGVYYIKLSVDNYRYSSESYTLRVNNHISNKWEKEFNNTFQTATSISVGQPFLGSMYGSDDSDWYEFEVKKKADYSIDFETDMIGDSINYWAIDLYHRTETIDLVKSWNISGEKNVISMPDVALDPGVYYIKVSLATYRYNPRTYQIIIYDPTTPPTPIVPTGDVNVDGEFNVADLVILQKWLLGTPDVTLADWQAADLCEDDRLDVFDLCLMRRELVKII